MTACILQVQAVNGQSPVLFVCCSLAATLAGWGPGVELLIKHGANLAAKTAAGDQALHWAAYKGNLQVVQLLVGAGADVNAVGDLGNRPLHLAVSGNHAQVTTMTSASCKGCATLATSCCHAD